MALRPKITVQALRYLTADAVTLVYKSDTAASNT